MERLTDEGLTELEERRAASIWNRDIEALNEHLEDEYAIVVFQYSNYQSASLITDVEYDEYHYHAECGDIDVGTPIAWLPWDGE